MLAEYDVERETEFNRQQLGTTIPKRLRELLAIIENSQGRLEEWYAILDEAYGHTSLADTINRARPLLKTFLVTS